MMCALKTTSTANIALALLVICGYLTYGFLNGLPIGDRFLGFGIDRRLQAPAWVGVLLIECGIVLTFILRQLFEMNQKPVRLACVVFGAAALLWTAILPALKAQIYGGEGITSNDILACYVWFSHVLYGLLGCIDDA